MLVCAGFMASLGSFAGTSPELDEFAHLSMRKRPSVLCHKYLQQSGKAAAAIAKCVPIIRGSQGVRNVKTDGQKLIYVTFKTGPRLTIFLQDEVAPPAKK